MLDVAAAVLIAQADPKVDISTFAVSHPVIDKGISAVTYVPRKAFAGVKVVGRGICKVGKRADSSGFNGFLGLTSGVANTAMPLWFKLFRR